MWDNRNGAPHAPDKKPDFRCKNRDCKDDRGYTTCIWRIEYQDEAQPQTDTENGDMFDDGPGY